MFPYIRFLFCVGGGVFFGRGIETGNYDMALYGVLGVVIASLLLIIEED